MSLSWSARLAAVAISAVLALPPLSVHAQPAGGEADAEGPAPGGYWGLAERPAPEPKDGDAEIATGSVLISLGTLRAGAALASYYSGTSGVCGHDADTCTNLRYYGFAGLGLGGLMFGTGVVFLALGLSRRKKHRAWELASFTPFGSPSRWSRGISVTLRF